MKKKVIFPLIAFLIHGLVDVPFFKNDLALHFWVVLALTAVVYIRIGENLKKAMK